MQRASKPNDLEAEPEEARRALERHVGPQSGPQGALGPKGARRTFQGPKGALRAPKKPVETDGTKGLKYNQSG